MFSLTCVSYDISKPFLKSMHVSKISFDAFLKLLPAQNHILDRKKKTTKIKQKPSSYLLHLKLSGDVSDTPRETEWRAGTLPGFYSRAKSCLTVAAYKYLMLMQASLIALWKCLEIVSRQGTRGRQKGRYGWISGRPRHTLPPGNMTIERWQRGPMEVLLLKEIKWYWHPPPHHFACTA